MSTQVSEGDQLLKAGNYRAAIALYESVLEADSDAETHAYYDAEDGIKVARSRILAVKTRSWQRVEAAFKDDDDAAAATALREILRVDPDDERAAQQLQNLEAAPK
jgi:predicted TPR repeat methyltransferase